MIRVTITGGAWPTPALVSAAMDNDLVFCGKAWTFGAVPHFQIASALNGAVFDWPVRHAHAYRPVESAALAGAAWGWQRT